jgi:hypothetical protein
VRRHGEDGGVVLEVREAVAVEAEDRVPGQRESSFDQWSN